MKHLIWASMLLICACDLPNNDTERLKDRVERLEKIVKHSYKPGMGEFMSGIQVQHAKLWFAGNAQNWKLAAYEIDEIKETMDAIAEYNTDRPEVKSISMINPALDSVTNAIQKEDLGKFVSSYHLLTQTCNNCHKATQHEFNVIKTPVTAPYSNQWYEPQY